jgi:hypothetical protein
VTNKKDDETLGLTEDPDTGKMMDKVAKLLRKAEGTDNPDEAQIFFEKAQGLITQYALDEAALHAKVNGGDGKTEKVGHEDVNFKSSYFNEDCHLWNAVAKANSCMVLMRKGTYYKKYAGGEGVTLVGTPSDRANVKILVASMMLQIARTSKTLPAYLENGTAFDKFVWRRSFRDGFTIVIERRLKDAMEGAARTHKSGDMLPVLRSRAQQVQDYASQEFNVSAARRTSKKSSWDGRTAGRQAGERADVGATRVNAATKGALGAGGKR